MKLSKSLQAWNTPDFEAVFKTELLSHDRSLLPLQQGLAHSSYALTDGLKVIVLNNSENENTLLIKAGIFYNGMIAGCNCADDPTPDELYPEYCEVMFAINRSNADTCISLVQ